MRRLATGALLSAIMTAACSIGIGRELRETPLPDLARLDAPVQEQIRGRHGAVLATVDRGASDAEIGTAFGELGMLLHAAEYYDAAEPAYLNAQDLMPAEPRWPYYLALLHRTRGDRARAQAAFTRVLELARDDVPALIGLARLYQDQGETDRAETLFTRAQQLTPTNVPVLAGLGQIALARKDFPRAVSLLEQVLSIDPSMASLHAPLATAYRALGDTAKAEAHLRLWRNTDIPIPDPRREALDLALESGLSYELRGVRLMTDRDFTGAADFFRRGVALTAKTTPLGRSLRHKLGTALFLAGDVTGAIRQFEETAALAPERGQDESAAKAHYSLGVIMASTGRHDAAIAHFEDAVRFSPAYLEARIALGDALRRHGRLDESLLHYREAMTISPRAVPARLGYAMALVRLRRYTDARDALVEAVRSQPDQAEFRHALARVYAAAPDPRARDGQQALALTQELFRTQPRTTALGETMAMTMAELGEFVEAVALQQGVLAAARRAGQEADVRRMTGNLRRYQRGEPCRTPWPDDDPVHRPGPPVDPRLVAATATRPS